MSDTAMKDTAMKDTAMNGYMLMLYNQDGDFEGYGPEEMQAIVERYKAWGDQLEAEGRFISSEKLVDDTGRVLSRQDQGGRVLDGPFSETKEIIGGYFAIRAASFDQAVEIARGCPHHQLGFTIEIRQVDPMH